MKELTKNNFNETINQDKLVVVDFWASWCGPCKMIEPILEELSEKLDSNSVEIAKLNVDGYPEYAMKYGVRNIPTMLFFRKGEIVDKSVGAITKNTINALIETNLQ